VKAAIVQLPTVVVQLRVVGDHGEVAMFVDLSSEEMSALDDAGFKMIVQRQVESKSAAASWFVEWCRSQQPDARVQYVDFSTGAEAMKPKKPKKPKPRKPDTVWLVQRREGTKWQWAFFGTHQSREEADAAIGMNDREHHRPAKYVEVTRGRKNCG
jgi:hypothetical protein